MPFNYPNPKKLFKCHSFQQKRHPKSRLSWFTKKKRMLKIGREMCNCHIKYPKKKQSVLLGKYQPGDYSKFPRNYFPPAEFLFGTNWQFFAGSTQTLMAQWRPWREWHNKRTSNAVSLIIICMWFSIFGRQVRAFDWRHGAKLTT